VRGQRVAGIWLLVSVLIAFAAVPPAGAWDSTKPTSGPDNPLAGFDWRHDWRSPAYLRYSAYGTQNLGFNTPWPDTDIGVAEAIQQRIPPKNREKGRLLWKIVRNPLMKRLTAADPKPGNRLGGWFWVTPTFKRNPNELTFLYLYRFPHRFKDEQTHSGPYCGNFDADGERGELEWRAWIENLAGGIADERTAVFLEPDGLMTMGCLTPEAQRRRYAMFRWAIQRLQAVPRTTVYIDGGHSGWMGGAKSIRTKARMLRRAGVLNARGFFLNATGYNRTKDEVAHGDKLVRLLGGKPRYVVSTAVNGNGPYELHRPLRYAIEQRCNPPGRALGQEPTVRTASRYADAYLWIGDPGRSGARCPHPGMPTAPTSGKWWEWYALMLARNAHWD
jgi:endoglucanase